MTVTLDWLGVATFRLIVDDQVFFLDAYMDRVPSAPSVGLRLAGEYPHGYSVRKLNLFPAGHRYELPFRHLFKLHQPYRFMRADHGRPRVVGNALSAPKMIEVGMADQHIVSSVHLRRP